MTHEGIRSLNKKVEAITNRTTPTSKNEVRALIGLVNYYQEIWDKHSHKLKPLTRLTSKYVNLKLTFVEQKAFDEVKLIVPHKNLLSYPYLNKQLDIHINTRDFQLEAVISQEGIPIAFYSSRLTDPLTRYTVIEKELLIIIEALKNFCTI